MTATDPIDVPRAPGPPCPGLTVRVRVTGEAQVVHLAGELDLATRDRVDEALRGPGHRRPRLVIDLSELTFTDSAGLNLLLHAQRRAHAAGREMVLTGVGGPVARTLQVTGLESVFELA